MLSRGRERRRVDEEERRLSPRGVEEGIRERRVRVAKERLHARRFFVRQIHEGPHWGSRQSTQYQFSAGTDRMPSHLTWHVFLHVPARDASPIDRSALNMDRFFMLSSKLSGAARGRPFSTRRRARRGLGGLVALGPRHFWSRGHCWR